MSRVRIRSTSAMTLSEIEESFRRREWNDPRVLGTCSEIIDGVRERGDAALVEYTRDNGAVAFKRNPRAEYKAFPVRRELGQRESFAHSAASAHAITHNTHPTPARIHTNHISL